jgi:hypothetical protein
VYSIVVRGSIIVIFIIIGKASFDGVRVAIFDGVEVSVDGGMVVYDVVKPGKSASFKNKEFAPKGTDSVAVKVVDAKIE